MDEHCCCCKTGEDGANGGEEGAEEEPLDDLGRAVGESESVEPEREEVLLA